MTIVFRCPYCHTRLCDYMEVKFLPQEIRCINDHCSILLNNPFSNICILLTPCNSPKISYYTAAQIIHKNFDGYTNCHYISKVK